MPNTTIGSVFRTVAQQSAAREMHKLKLPMRKVLKQVRSLRQAVKEQKRTIRNMEGRIGRLKEKTAVRHRKDGVRIAPDAVRSFRRRVGMTREQFARLLGVSPGSIYGWEAGNTRPRTSAARRFLDVRKLGVKKIRNGAIRLPRAARRSRRK